MDSPTPLDERDKIVRTGHPQAMRWLLFAGVLTIAVLAIWIIPQDPTNRNVRAESQAVGTSGTHDGSAEGAEGRVLTEIETITGANDTTALIGRRVDLHVDVQSQANDYAFWVGSPDNRLLVVFGRDNRGGTKRQSGVPASHGIAPVRGGQRATISGVIQPIPRAEDRLNWNLTQQDERDLADRKIYIRADTVTADDHGAS